VLQWAHLVVDAEELEVSAWSSVSLSDVEPIEQTASAANVTGCGLYWAVSFR
jgi:hypothetical protein